MAAATRLGYRTNWAAKALASDHSRLIGLLLCGQHGTPTEIVRGLEQRLAEAGYVTLLGFAPDAARTAAAVARLAERGSEAIVSVGDSAMARETDSLSARSLPCIAIADAGEGARIAIGREDGGALAVRYLLDLKHERFAVIERTPGATARGVAQALEGSGLRFAESPALGDDPNALKRAIHGLLDLPYAPTGIVCGDDAIALAVVRDCLLGGRQVPRDISIVGFGDEPYARCALPSLTTVRVPMLEAGIHAAEAVLAMLDGKPFEPYKPAVKLAIRETTGPPP